MPSRNHKASAHSARWRLVIKSSCSWARWPYCCCMLSSLFSDASIVVLWRAKGDVASFSFSNVLVLLDPGGSQLPHNLLYFMWSPSVEGPCRFVFENQPPDVSEFQFYKVVQLPFFFIPDCILHLFPLLTIHHLIFYWSTPWIDVKALT